MILVLEAVEYILDFRPVEMSLNKKTASFSSVFDVFSQFYNHTHKQVLSDLGSDLLNTEDEFFDYFMTFFEKINYLQPRIRLYIFQAIKEPKLYKCHIKTLQHIALKLKDILPKMSKEKYFTTLAILPAVLYVWLQDESEDLHHTMKKLQQVSRSFYGLISNH